MERRLVKSSTRSEPESEPHSAVVWEEHTGAGFPASWQSLHGLGPPGEVFVLLIKLSVG